MIVYGVTVSPYVRKVMAFGAEKGVALTLERAGPGLDVPEFTRVSPFGKIPAFTDGDFAIADSSAIVTYLEAKFPEPNLIPTTPAARARTVWFDEFADTILFDIGSRSFVQRIIIPRFKKQEPDLALADKTEQEDLPPLFAYLEREIPASGFLVEDRLTLADISVAAVLASLWLAEARPSSADYPKLAAWLAAIHARPSFAAYLAADQALVTKLGGPVR